MLALSLGLLLQVATPVGTDSVMPVSFPDFGARVQSFHPVARTARASADAAEQDVRVARGSFDPTITATWDRKRFAGKTYYDEVAAELKIPTTLGVDVKVALERSLGTNVNPQAFTPQGGLVTIGVSIPIGQRLLTDERRAALQQARAVREAVDGDRASAINRLLLAAARDYARWYEAWRREGIAREGTALAAFRLDGVRRRYQTGEVPAIDTLEARLEVQRREGQFIEARQALVTARLVASAYLWDEQLRPVELAPNAVPTLNGLSAAPVDSTALASWLDEALRVHPDLARAGARLRALEAQQRLFGQQLIPLVGLDLATLGSGDAPTGGALEDNFKAGLNLSSPLLYLRERGRLGGVNRRLDALRFDLARARRDVSIAVRSAANDVGAAERLVALQRITVVQARTLLAGEQRRFDNGESSLLIVNLRERLLLDEEVRLVQLEARQVGARAELATALGRADPLP